MNRVGFGWRIGYDEADTAADLGRRHQTEDVMEVRRALLNAREFRYPIMLHLHRWSGSTLDSFVWDQGSWKKQRKVDIRVNVDHALLPGPPGFLDGRWIQVHGGCISGADVAAWPKSVNLLCNLSAFLASLHWPFRGGGHCTLVSRPLRFLFSLSDGLNTVCAVRKLLVTMFVHTSLYLFLLLLCQKEKRTSAGC